MEKTDYLLDEIRMEFPVGEDADIRNYSPLKLAYLGDAVYEIILRTIVLEHMGGPVKKMHAKTSSFVNAKAQSDLVQAMAEYMTQEEENVYRRGRNAKASSVAKNADVHDYRNATGLEALFGYLYLKGELARAISLLKNAMDKLEIHV